MHNHDDLNPIFDYNKITENIFIGNNQCCHMGLDRLLSMEGIFADLSLEEDEVDKPTGVQSFLWLPIVDHTPPDMDQMNLGINFIDEVVNIGKKIYVHCKNGHGRAPTMVMAYLIQKKHKSYNEAFSIVNEARPTMHLDEAQKDFLKTLAK